MSNSFIHKIDAITPAVFEQWISEISGEEKSTAKKGSK